MPTGRKITAGPVIDASTLIIATRPTKYAEVTDQMAGMKAGEAVRVTVDMAGAKDIRRTLMRARQSLWSNIKGTAKALPNTFRVEITTEPEGLAVICSAP